MFLITKRIKFIEMIKFLANEIPDQRFFLSRLLQFSIYN